jgi:hypothetical protein
LPVEKSKIYLKTLALEVGEHPTSYIQSMQEYDTYFQAEFNFKMTDLKRQPLKDWQIDIFRRLNPTEFEINSMREEGTYNRWLEWFSQVRKYPKNGQYILFPKD